MDRSERPDARLFLLNRSRLKCGPPRKAPQVDLRLPCYEKTPPTGLRLGIKESRKAYYPSALPTLLKAAKAFIHTCNHSLLAF